jgi:hypothetical protein
MRSLTFCVHLKVALQHSNYMPSWYNSWPFRCDCVLGTAKQDLQPRHMQHRVPTATAASSFSFVSVQYLPFSCPLLSAPAHAIWPDGRTRFWRRPRFVWLSSVDCWFSPELAGTSGNRCRWLHSGSTSTTMARTGPTVLPVSVWIWAPEQQCPLFVFPWAPSSPRCLLPAVWRLPVAAIWLDFDRHAWAPGRQQAALLHSLADQ